LQTVRVKKIRTGEGPRRSVRIRRPLSGISKKKEGVLDRWGNSEGEERGKTPWGFMEHRKQRRRVWIGEGTYKEKSNKGKE